MFDDPEDFNQRNEAIANAAIRWIREHGYIVAWDTNNDCYRIILEGIDRANDEKYPAEFRNRRDAYYRVFQLVSGEK